MGNHKPSDNGALIHRIKEVYEGKVFSFVVEDITLQNASRTEMGMIRHPGSTAVVPLAEDGTVVMVKQYRHPVGTYVLEIPAGTRKPKESPRSCAMRELEEETGYIAVDLIELSDVYMVPAYSDEKVHLFLARGLTPSEQNLDKDEIIEVVRYPLEEVMDMISKGLLKDSLTIIALHQAWLYLQKRT